MNEYMCGDFFGEKPHRDGALAESRCDLNSYHKLMTMESLVQRYQWLFIRKTEKRGLAK